MRCVQWLGVGLAGAALMVRSSAAVAQEAIAKEIVEPPQNSAEKVIVSEDLIPLEVITVVLANSKEQNRLGITPLTASEIRSIARNADMTRVMRRHLESMLSQAGASTPRWSKVLAKQEATAIEVLERKAADLLTKEQHAEIERVNRTQLTQLRNRRRAAMNLAPPTIDHALSSNDLLALLESQPFKRGRGLTVEQVRQIDALSTEAEAATKVFVEQLFEQEIAPVAPKPILNGRHDEFMKATLAVLSEPQRTAFDELMRKRKADFAARQQAAKPNEVVDFTQALPHGAPYLNTMFSFPVFPIQFQYRNVFTDQDAKAALKLTDAQQDRIQSILDVFSEEFSKEMAAQNAAHQQATADAYEQLRNRVLALQLPFHERAKAILTAEQWQSLVKERWMVLGIYALLKSEVAEQLELNDSQRDEIRETLTLPISISPFPAFVRPGAKPPSPEEFAKPAEEQFRQMRAQDEARREQKQQSERDAWSRLTPRQQTAFTTLTGWSPK